MVLNRIKSAGCAYLGFSTGKNKAFGVKEHPKVG